MLNSDIGPDRVYSANETPDENLSSERARSRESQSESNYDLFLINNANLLIDHAQYDLAQNLLGEVLRHNPYHTVAISKMGEVFFKLKDYENALRCQISLDKISRSETNLFRMSQTLYEMGRLSEARAKLIETLSILSGEDLLYFDVFKTLGNIDVRLGDYDSAEEYYNKAFALNSNSDTLLVNYGTLEIQRGNVEQARRRYQEAVCVNPKSDKAWLGLGLIHRNHGDNDLAWAALLKALDANSMNETSISIVADWSLKDGRVSEGILYVENYLEKFPESGAILQIYILMLWSVGRRFEADIEFERFCTSNPDSQVIPEIRKMLVDR